MYSKKAAVMMWLVLIAFVSSVIIFSPFFLFATANHQARHHFDMSLFLLFLVGFLLALIINVWVQVALFYVIKEKEVKVTLKSILLLAWDNIGSYSWVLFLKGIIILIGFALFIIPGIILSVWFGFPLYSFVFDDVKGGKALTASKNLVKGYWWAVFGRLCLLFIVMYVISFIPFLGLLINLFILMPFSIVYGYVIFEDLKRIKALPR